MFGSLPWPQPRLRVFTREAVSQGIRSISSLGGCSIDATGPPTSHGAHEAFRCYLRSLYDWLIYLELRKLSQQSTLTAVLTSLPCGPSVRTVRTDRSYGPCVRTIRTNRPYEPSVLHRFFNDFGWVGLEHVDFPLVFSWFLGCSLSRRVIRLRSGPPAARPRGGFRDPFYHLKNPLAKRY